MDPNAMRHDAGEAGEGCGMGPDSKQVEPGRPSEARESPSGAAKAAELLAEIWFANFVSGAERRPARWLAPADYCDVMALLCELARDCEASEVSELLDGASDGDELVTVWCYLIDEGSPALRRRWRPALQACKHALLQPAERPTGRPFAVDQSDAKQKRSL